MPHLRHYLLLPLAMTIFAGCASTPEGGAEQSVDPAPATPRITNNAATGKVTLERPLDALVNTVRLMGEQESGGIVLMHGLGFETAGPYDWKNRGFGDAVQELANDAGLALSTSGPYAFLYPAGYEVLDTWQLEAIPGAGDSNVGGIAFGHGTKLSSALAFLGHSTGVTIIVDNAIADARTGEMWLPSLPLRTVIEAVFKGARVPPGSVQVETGNNLIYFRSSGNQSTPRMIGASAPELEATATVYLPYLPEKREAFPMLFAARTLGEILPALSRQLGITVDVAPGFEELPVEQCVFINQPRATILNYLIAQWPAPGIGYRWTGTGVSIERFTP